MPLQTDLAALQAFVSDFEAYLGSDTVFYNVGGNLPALSLGGLQYLRRALAARRGQLSTEQQGLLSRLESQAGQLLNARPVNVEKKALREISSRLNVWAAALDELGEDYAQAVTQRAYLALLLPLAARAPEADKHRQRLTRLDILLRSRFQTGPFVWEPPLAPAFPPDEFWFLYGRPRLG